MNVPLSVIRKARADQFMRDMGMDGPQKPDPVCECGHTDGEHYDFGHGKCEAKDCGCLKFKEKVAA